ncbi:formate--tetrahydrofolate ligase [Striga asiatica]|uniref:Formate--tetrahydrofolate ligase n=1 Tax=Striga asiatica TaxID=4170 RepID=A0A5A7QZV8_STRAF|nr:formate--tetrahydrofolate ligase [Striga asiatica]
MCLIAISKDFFESVLPNPELSGDEDFPDKLLRGEFLSSILGGASFLILITLSTILVPTRTGLTLSFAFACSRFTAGTGTELPLLCETPLGGRPLAGEHDCRLTRPFEPGSTEEDRGPGAPGRPRVTDGCLSDIDVLRLGGASSENPGISEGFHIFGRTVGLETEEAVGDFTAVLITGRRVGVEARDVDLDEGMVGPGTLVGVEERAVDREVGVEDLAAVGGAGLDEERVGREVVGVEDREGFDDVDRDEIEEVAGLVRVGRDVEVRVGRPVGVEGLDPDPPEEDGRRRLPLEVFSREDDEDDVCLEDRLFLEMGSGGGLASFRNGKKLQMKKKKKKKVKETEEFQEVSKA